MGEARETHRRFAHAPFGGGAAVDLGSPWPARFYGALLDRMRGYRLPPSGAVPWVRHSLSTRLSSSAVSASWLRVSPRRSRPDLDRLMGGVVRAWDALASRATDLPPRPPQLSCLALRRSSALTVFVFGTRPAPLVVVKVPWGGRMEAEREARALVRGQPAEAGPRLLGRIGPAYVQEAVDGMPLDVVPAFGDGREDPGAAAMSPVFEALTRLAAVTATEDPSSEASTGIDGALAYDGLDERSRESLLDAKLALAGMLVSVLRHGDVSPQNCLSSSRRPVTLVDWERAVDLGAPGFETWTAAMSWLEHRVGSTRWSQEAVLEAFHTEWFGPFGSRATAGVRGVLEAAGVNGDFLEPLEVAFFARRLARRMERPRAYAASVETAAKMLRSVCAR